MKKLHILLFLFSFCLTSFAQAGPVPWKENSYTYYAHNTTLGKALSDFAKTFGIQIKGHESLTEKLDGRFATISPSDYLHRLAGLYGLSWYYYNGTLFINRSNTNVTKPIVVGADSLPNVKRALTALGILDPRFGWGELPEQSLVLVSGPPSYIALLEKTISSIPTSSLGQQVMVFRLRYANVDDRVVTYNDKNFTTPGVATIIRQLVDGSYSGGSNITHGVGSQSQLIDIAKPVRVGTPALELPDPTSSLPNTPPPNLQKTRSGPTISSDSRLNALIIKDTADTEPIYRQLISLLDHPTALIQIEAMIVDVDVNRMSELGINWAARRGHTSLGFGDLTKPSNSLALAIGNTLNPTSTVLDAGNRLISQINILEQKNNAQIIGRPSILTSDNLPALIAFNDSYYVKIQGEKVANLQQVTAGMTLRVTPRVIQKEGNNRIYLAVDIEDGQILDVAVNKLPSTRTSTINTQAVLTENESLLIGGYIRDKISKSDTGIPVLSKIPLFGRLFRSTSNDKARAERLFMITPKIISLPANTPMPNGLTPSVEGDITSLQSSPTALPTNFPADSIAREAVTEKIATLYPKSTASSVQTPSQVPATRPSISTPLPALSAPVTSIAIPGNLVQKQPAQPQKSPIEASITTKKAQENSQLEIKPTLETPTLSALETRENVKTAIIEKEASPLSSAPPPSETGSEEASSPMATYSASEQKPKTKRHSPFFFWKK